MTRLATTSNIPTMDSMPGLWTRSKIAWPDGTTDCETSVFWLQGPRAYIDLRQRRPLKPVSGASLSELTMADVEVLAEQEGFGGYLNSDGRYFEWIRTIDFQPVSPYSDCGTLKWVGDVLVEEGRDVRYLEDWHRSPEPATPCAALALKSEDSPQTALVVRVGSLFMYARSRSAEIPAGETLAQSIAGAASIEIARARIDCEISFGQILRDTWQILYSTLPYKAWSSFSLKASGHEISTADIDAHGAACVRRWRADSIEGPLDSLLEKR